MYAFGSMPSEGTVGTFYFAGAYASKRKVVLREGLAGRAQTNELFRIQPPARSVIGDLWNQQNSGSRYMTQLTIRTTQTQGFDYTILEIRCAPGYSWQQLLPTVQEVIGKIVGEAVQIIAGSPIPFDSTPQTPDAAREQKDRLQRWQQMTGRSYTPI